MTVQRVLSVGLSIFLLSCESVSTYEADNAGITNSAASVQNAEMETAEKYLEQAAEVVPEEFVDQVPGVLEAMVGEPAFVRAEGVGEFRRYDLAICRIYALITPDEGGRPRIRSVNVGGLTTAETPPSLGSCIGVGR